MPPLADRISAALHTPVRSTSPLGGGAAGSVWRVELNNGSTVVAKVADQLTGPGLTIEARMLALLSERSDLPLPRVLHAEPDLLVMEHIPGRSSFDDHAQRHAARLLAALHAVHSPDARYGLELDALIGPLHQPNTPSPSWVAFWRDQRLLHMSREAVREGRLPAPIAARIDALARRLPDLLPDSPPPSLIHGDVWSGNVLAHAGRITAFLDPAPYHAHHEVELAFITLFSTFGHPFFDEYASHTAPISPEFWSTRRHVYLLYPLLVHTRLFGGSYLSELSSTLDMLNA